MNYTKESVYYIARHRSRVLDSQGLHCQADYPWRSATESSFIPLEPTLVVYPTRATVSGGLPLHRCTLLLAVYPERQYIPRGPHAAAVYPLVVTLARFTHGCYTAMIYPRGLHCDSLPQGFKLRQLTPQGLYRAAVYLRAATHSLAVRGHTRAVSSCRRSPWGRTVGQEWLPHEKLVAMVGGADGG